MAYYYRGNLAVDVDKSRSSVVKKKKTIVIRSAIPTGEKLLYLFLIMVLVAGVGFVGLRYIQISEYNYQIQATKNEMARLQGENADLLLKIEQMSNRERIEQEAKAMGMSPAESVHVIGAAEPGQKDQLAQKE
ncbi:septum formation initiator family protein [Brevibacillus humidisoli]|uniref:septum formation initiator family protein n=1 Tax=Brevibacillus humidisoli TaxID=2895522 RepID=UPI001E3C7EFC|nr:cell division protein FtsL [Brevibacillus humidisoli]UFJ41917.1 septum formation initiator family protein [Brevibacillus humidisoli]